MTNYSVCPYCGTPVEVTPQNINQTEENGIARKTVTCELCKKVVFLPSVKDEAED